MGWKKARKKDLPEILRFLSPREWRAVAFTSRLKKGESASFPPHREASIYCFRTRTGLSGAVLATTHGLILPQLSQGQPQGEGEEYRNPVPPLPPELSKDPPYLHSVMGPARDVGWVVRGLPMAPLATNTYYLMTLTRRRFRELEAAAGPGIRGVRIRPASVEELDRLFLLQKDYELEDVVVSRDNFDDRVCYLNLKKLLRTQIMVLAEWKGEVVAKGNTNARGFNYDQIGGVFTVRAYRNRGFAYLVIQDLLRRIFRTRKGASLFVKKTNRPALALYRKLGFTVAEGYQISYYRP